MAPLLSASDKKSAGAAQSLPHMTCHTSRKGAPSAFAACCTCSKSPRGWTEDEHRSYLDSVEALFTHAMYNRLYCDAEVCGAPPSNLGGCGMLSHLTCFGRTVGGCAQEETVHSVRSNESDAAWSDVTSIEADCPYPTSVPSSPSYTSPASYPLPMGPSPTSSLLSSLPFPFSSLPAPRNSCTYTAASF